MKIETIWENQDNIRWEIVKRSAKARHYHQRIWSMLKHIAVTKGHPNGDNKQSLLKLLRVNKQWPVSGTVTVERIDDGAVFALGHSFKQNKFTIKEIRAKAKLVS